MDIVPNDTERIGIAEPTQEEERRACVQTCVDCAMSCMELVDYCLQEGGEYNQPGHIRQLLSCARICQLAADVMLLNSAEYKLICRTCAEICLHTNEDFEVYEHDGRMRFTAHLARRCAETCLRTAQQSQ